jgi:predicted N-acyltransferase
MVQALDEIMHNNHFSSVHVLFPNEDSAAILKQENWLQRHGVQFQWHNESFQSFDEFLSKLTQEKRKKIRQERNKVVNSGVVCHRIKGQAITEAQWDFFYQCYCNTYLAHRSTPYLTRAFFKMIAKTMPEQILLVMAYKDGAPIASALNFYDQNTLFGRYWGCLEYVPNLHFEVCYYQAQEFCIAEKIQYFEGGAQGEHKLARGFKPKATCSFHKIAHPQFAKAIEDFVIREALGIAEYTNELEDRAPFKSSATSL